MTGCDNGGGGQNLPKNSVTYFMDRPEGGASYPPQDGGSEWRMPGWLRDEHGWKTSLDSTLSLLSTWNILNPQAPSIKYVTLFLAFFDPHPPPLSQPVTISRTPPWKVCHKMTDSPPKICQKSRIFSTGGGGVAGEKNAKTKNFCDVTFSLTPPLPPVTNCHTFSTPHPPPKAWHTLWTAPNSRPGGGGVQIKKSPFFFLLYRTPTGWNQELGWDQSGTFGLGHRLMVTWCECSYSGAYY